MFKEHFNLSSANGRGVHWTLRRCDTFQKKVALLNNYTSQGDDSIHFLKAFKFSFQKCQLQFSRSGGFDFIGDHVPKLSQHTSLHLKCYSSYIYRIICFKFVPWGSKWRRIRTCKELFCICLYP